MCVVTYLDDRGCSNLVRSVSLQENMQLLPVSIVVVSSIRLVHSGHEILQSPSLVLQVSVLQHHSVVWYNILSVAVHVQSLGVSVEYGNQDGLIFIGIQQVESHCLWIGASECHFIGETRGHDPKEC